jgi:hypothetical protein
VFVRERTRDLLKEFGYNAKDARVITEKLTEDDVLTYFIQYAKPFQAHLKGAMHLPPVAFVALFLRFIQNESKKKNYGFDENMDEGGIDPDLFESPKKRAESKRVDLFDEEAKQIRSEPGRVHYGESREEKKKSKEDALNEMFQEEIRDAKAKLKKVEKNISPLKLSPLSLSNAEEKERERKIKVEGVRYAPHPSEINERISKMRSKSKAEEKERGLRTGEQGVRPAPHSSQVKQAMSKMLEKEKQMEIREELAPVVFEIFELMRRYEYYLKNDPLIAENKEEQLNLDTLYYTEQEYLRPGFEKLNSTNIRIGIIDLEDLGVLSAEQTKMYEARIKKIFGITQSLTQTLAESGEGLKKRKRRVHTKNELYKIKVLMGEIRAGNDSPKIVKQLRKLLV